MSFRFTQKIGVFANVMYENPYWEYPVYGWKVAVQIMLAALMHETVPSAVMAALTAAAKSCRRNFIDLRLFSIALNPAQPLPSLQGEGQGVGCN